MATKRRKNSAVRFLDSDLSMLAGKEGITSTSRESMMRVFGNPIETDSYANPIHIPKTTRGRPSKDSWWILDLYDSKKAKIRTEIGSGAKRSAEHDAASFIGHRAKPRGRGTAKLVKSAMLSGPYSRKPTTKTKRK